MATARPIDPQSALQTLWDMAPKYAQAKASRVYLEEYRKTLKATLMKEHIDKPLGAQEREASAAEPYVELLAGLREAGESEETFRWRLVAAQAAIEVWRSQEASNRTMDRAAA